MSSPQSFRDAWTKSYGKVHGDAHVLKPINLLTNLWNALETLTVKNNKQEPNVEIKTPDVGNALLTTVLNLFCGIISAAHGIFMQWAILFLVGNIVLIDFNDLLREDLEKLLDGETPDLSSPGVLALILWALEMLVSLTMALLYQNDDKVGTDEGLITWGWKVGIWAATPFFLLDGIAIIGLALWFAGLLGGQALLWAGSTQLGRIVLLLAQIGAAGKILGPSLIRVVKSCASSLKLHARALLDRLDTLRKAGGAGANGEAEMCSKDGTGNLSEAGSEANGNVTSDGTTNNDANNNDATTIDATTIDALISDATDNDSTDNDFTNKDAATIDTIPGIELADNYDMIDEHPKSNKRKRSPAGTNKSAFDLRAQCF